MSKRREGGATLEEIEVLYRTRLPQFRRVAAAILGPDSVADPSHHCGRAEGTRSQFVESATADFASSAESSRDHESAS